jgi:hypothetical protein
MFDKCTENQTIFSHDIVLFDKLKTTIMDKLT